MAKKLRICETVLRDGHQSILATRMRYEQMEPVLGLLDEIGYEALECWGGATYDSCLRFLNEDPWERLRKLKSNLKNTPLQMLLRGQNLLGYKHYSDDVVEAFCNAAVKNGIDRIRIFDALNDPRNMEAAIKYSKKAGAHVQSAMVYTISPVHTTESFLKVAETLVEMGTDSLCIKDMSGLLGPADAYDLVSTFKKRFGELPIDLHSHFTCGLASTTYWEAAKAGVDIIDTAISPFAHATSQPATETMIEMFKGTEWDLGLDLDKYIPLVDHFRKVKQQIAEEFNLKPASDVIPAVRRYQIPGGMLSNTQNQLNEMGMGDRFFDVMDEMPRVREDLGYPPLVTPTSQIVGTMAMMNVMMGDRYKMVPNEVKDLVRGKYGALPGTISDEIRQTIIGDEQPITCRPADLIEPELEGYRQDLATKGYNGITDEDVLTYAMFPEVAINFFEANRR
ncbi:MULTISPECIES: pyruvate carboxylase subunit B [Veillonella]|uniref:Oxaloacetate decarboxylase n=1 Tax=Veillonella rogosae JCM 15642 TaxID=1298595 RepID=A0ABX5BYX8_9FIRM|nr:MULTISPECIES: pyruvate carboxylase subunit B [Veillonella]EFR60100.1 conserved carboxylase domain protein [Veillonella sp. oral taxon 158 str. F0412]MBF1746360.1 pyruvate carboxylase subunit B [Veillonella sp.]MBF1759316.1 pyruvate carboxylase subunit B [Veillonella sp.]MBF1764569.1 pyruvate carboxylase subunit B [Veillonella sp.]MDU2710779.1 pyruvate carboxylase subunit B [Veillonella sp.]